MSSLLTCNGFCDLIKKILVLEQLPNHIVYKKKKIVSLAIGNWKVKIYIFSMYANGPIDKPIVIHLKELYIFI